VYTPTLSGLGERAHLLGCVEGLDTHVNDVLGVIEYEDLEDMVLVGHSYGGVVITAVAEIVAEKLSHLVYLDAWVPKDGQAMFDLMPPERAEGYREAPTTALIKTIEPQHGSRSARKSHRRLGW
jgi:pimeloyl-ACP methyl ester carboxylesterase